MKLYVLITLIGGTCGYILTTLGATIHTWQLWGILACMIAAYLVGSFRNREGDDEYKENDV